MLTVDSEREDDGRWIAEIAAVPGVLTYGTSRKEAIAKAEALALRVLADRVEHGEVVPELNILFSAARVRGDRRKHPAFLQHWSAMVGNLSANADHIESSCGQAGRILFSHFTTGKKWGHECWPGFRSIPD